MSLSGKLPSLRDEHRELAELTNEELKEELEVLKKPENKNKVVKKHKKNK